MSTEGSSTPRSGSTKRSAPSPPSGENQSKKMGDRNRRNSKKDNGSLESLMLEIEARQSERLDKLMSGLESTNAEVKEVKNLIKSREEAILREVREKDAKTNARIDELATALAAAGTKCSGQTEAYREHRRSLRLWPVKGTPGKEMRLALFTFMKETLKIPADDVCKLGNISIKRYKDPANKANDEVIVIFETRGTRDLVKSFAKNLANNPDAGLKIHVPAHLERNFKTLHSLGYHLRQSDETIRRAIKFDDEFEDLAMDIRVDGVWSRIRPAEAKEVCAANPGFFTGPKVLSSVGISGLLKKKTPATGANSTPME